MKFYINWNCSNNFNDNQVITGSLDVSGRFGLYANNVDPNNPPNRIGLFYGYSLVYFLTVIFINKRKFSMAAGKYSFVIEQGSTVDFEIQYRDADSIPINLTGYSGKMQIRSDFADSNPITYATLNSTPSGDGTGLNFNGSNGTLPLSSGSIGIYISAASSSAFTFDTAYYDLELTSGSFVTRILEGRVKLSKEVTR